MFRLSLDYYALLVCLELFIHGKRQKKRKEKVGARKIALAERKVYKKAFRRYRRHLFFCRECRRAMIDKYGNVSRALLCVPCILRCVLWLHSLLTWWISISLRVNITKLLEEAWFRYMAKEFYEHRKQHSSVCLRVSMRKLEVFSLY